jgi:C4-dicarboxylate transporter DctQ subunit
MRIGRLIEKVFRGVTSIGTFMEILAETGACMLAVVVIWGVILTYGFQSSDIFSVEISEYLLVFISFASIAYVLKENRHVRVEVFIEKLSPRPRLVIDIFTAFLALVFCLIVAWKSAVVAIFNFEKGFRSASLVSFPMWIPYIVISGGCFLLLLQYIVYIRELIGKLKTTPESTTNEILKKE